MMCVYDDCRCFLSLHPALLTFYIPLFLLVVFCAAVVVHAYCTPRRQSVPPQQRQLCCDQVDAKLQLLSVASSSCPSSDDVDRVRSTRLCDRTLTVLTLMMVFGVLSWGCAAAAAVLEQQPRTLAGTVAACFYAVCTSTVALLLFVVHSPPSIPSSASKCSWEIFTRLEQLTSRRKFNNRRTDGNNVPGQPPSADGKQVVYSIADSAPSSFHVCTMPIMQDGDNVDYITDNDEQEAELGMRDCTGSSCSVPASLSAVQLPSLISECEECKLCRSATDGSTDGRSFSRHSTRLRDFDDFSWSSDDENYDDGSLEGGWWNSKVDIDGCSIHRAPCPSPASACSSRADLEDRSYESRQSPQHPAAVWSCHGQCKRRWSVVGASPGTSRKTPRRRRQEDDTQYTRYRRRQKTSHSQTRGTDYIRSASTERCSPGLITRQKRRRISSKPRLHSCDT